MWVFGSGTAAECVIAQSGSSGVFGICVDDEFLASDEFCCGYEVVGYSTIKTSKPKIFVAMGYSDLNRQRARICEKLEKDGCQLVSVVDLSKFPFEFSYGKNSLVLDGAVIQPFVQIGSNVFVWSGATICHHCVLGDNIWITAGATLAGGSSLGDNVFVGANATIASGISIGSNVFIGAGAVVTKNLPDNAVVIEKSTRPMEVDANSFVKFLDNKGSY